MMTSLYLDIPYHQQDHSYYCGLATAQMLLGSILQKTPSQIVLANHPVVSDLGILDADLAALLNTWAPKGFGTFTNIRYPDPEAGMHAIVKTLFDSRIAVPAEIFLGPNGHWVAITGAVVEGGKPPDEPYEIKGFFLHNPDPVTAIVAASTLDPDEAPDAYPPPPFDHRTGDHCGEGRQRGAKHVYYTAYAWKHYNWATADCIAISNGHQPTADDYSHSTEATLADHGPAPAAQPITDDPAAVSAASAGIASHGLDKLGPFAGLLGDVRTARVDGQKIGSPVKETWSCVSFTFTNGNHATALVAQNGEFLALMASTHGEVPYDAEQLAMTSLMFGEDVTVTDFADHLATRNYRMQEPRFWLPCEQSMSPFHPFVKAQIDGHTVFIGQDKRVHRELRRGRCSSGRR
jgi:hypothetical protein